MSKETFLRIAEVSGLDAKDPHMDDLWAFLQGVFPAIKAVNEFQVGDAEPSVIFIPPKE